MYQRKININKALVMVTSVPNRFLMIGPFLLSMIDQWHIVMTKSQRSRIYYSIKASLIDCEFIKWFSLHHQFPVRDHLSSTSHKLLSRMAGRGIACQCLHVNVLSYLWRTKKKKEAQVEM